MGVFLQKKETKRFAENKITSTFALAKSDKTLSLYDSVAQLVEQMTLNHWVESSSLSGVTAYKKVLNKVLRHLRKTLFEFKANGKTRTADGIIGAGRGE